MNQKIKPLAAILAALLCCTALASCNKKSAEAETTAADGLVYEYGKGTNSEKITAGVTYKDGKEISRNDYEYQADGKLKTVTSYENGVLTDTWSYLYADDGKICESVRQYTDNSDECKDVYEYNEAGSVTRLSSYDGDTFCGCYNYTYNAAGEVTYDEQLDKNGDRIAYTEYEFADDGKASKASYYQYGSVSQYWTYEYNDNGDKTSVKFFSSKDKQTSETRYEYDNEKRLVKTLSYDADGTLTGYTESLYDADGFNYRDICYEGGEPVCSYDYSKDGTSVCNKY